MSDKDQIKELFSEKLGGYEAKVNPELWTNIASQVGTTASTAASAGMSLITKIIIGVSAASVITTGVILYSNSNDNKPTPKQEETNKVADLSNEDEENDLVYTQDRNTGNTIETVSVGNDIVVDNNAANINIVPNTVEEPIPGLQNAPVPGNVGVLDEFFPQSNNFTTEENNISDNSNTETEVQKNQLLQDNPMDRLSEEDEPTNAVSEEIQEDQTNEIKEFTFDLPNVITPNGDRANDVLTIEIDEDLIEFQIVVLNRSGQKVFESLDPDFIWDCQHMLTGELLQGEGFVYFVIAKNSEKTTVRKSQSLSIYR